MTLARRPDPPLWAVNGIYGVVRPGLEWLARRILDVEVTGRENMPERGPVVIAANHLSFIDPVMFAMAARRNVRFLAVGFLFNQLRLFTSVITYFGAIPTARDVLPIAAMRRAIYDLQQGEVIGLFPEGRRVTHWGEEDPTRGAAWLALATGAKLVPMAMQGTQGTMSIMDKRVRRTSVHIWLEKPLDSLDYVDTSDPTREMMRDWQAAMDRRLGPWWPPDGTGEPVTGRSGT